MSEPHRRRMTADEFLDWQTRQDRNYELVDGVPVLPLKSMTGATHRHDRVSMNAKITLGTQLRGKPCRPVSSDIAVRVSANGIRRPDLTVDRGPFPDRSMEAPDPRLVVEVLSPSTMNFDRIRKLDEYRAHPAIQVIILAETRRPTVGLWRRVGGEWQVEEYEGLEALIALPEIGVSLRLSDLYDGLTFSSGDD